MENTISTMDLLSEMGFDKKADSHNLYRYQIGRWELIASPCWNQFGADVVMLGGVISDGNEMSEMHVELPAQVESRELGFALVAWRVDNSFRSILKRWALEPWWLVEGRNYREHLPHVRYQQEAKAQHARYMARPHCTVEREWARLALKRLRTLIDANGLQSHVTFAFDGRVLTIEYSSQAIPLPAQGQPWTDSYSINADAFQEFPKRFMKKDVTFGVWKSSFQIDANTYNGVEVNHQS